MLAPPPPGGGAAALAGFQMIAAFQVKHPRATEATFLHTHAADKQCDGRCPHSCCLPGSLVPVRTDALSPASISSCDARRHPWPLQASMRARMRASSCSHRSLSRAAQGRTALLRCGPSVAHWA